VNILGKADVVELFKALNIGRERSDEENYPTINRCLDVFSDGDLLCRSITGTDSDSYAGKQ